MYRSQINIALVALSLLVAGPALAQEVPMHMLLYAPTGDQEHDKICHPGFSTTLRYPASSAAYRRMRNEAFRLAGIPVSKQCHPKDTRDYCYILDHIIPLEL